MIAERYMNRMLPSVYSNYVPNFGPPIDVINPEVAGVVGNSATAGGLKGWFGSHFGKGNALINKNLNIPNLHQMGSNLRATSLWQGGPTVATAANTIGGIYQGGKAIKGLYENSTKGDDLESLKDDISLQIASNPMYTNALDASDERMLRQMNNGTLTNGVGNAAGGAIKGIPQAALAALLGGIAGGPLGAIIGGGGSLLNSGIEGYGQGLDRANAKLQGLYGKLRDANDEYRSMKRPSGLRRAGLQSRYYNQLY